MIGERRSNSAPAADTLVLSGGTEDGWEALHFALNHYSIRPEALLCMILVSDEDRDTVDSSLNYQTILDELNAFGAGLNVVVNGRFEKCARYGCIGPLIGNSMLIWLMAVAVSPVAPAARRQPAVEPRLAIMLILALDTPGSAWNLNSLRQGGGYGNIIFERRLDSHE